MSYGGLRRQTHNKQRSDCRGQVMNKSLHSFRFPNHVSSPVPVLDIQGVIIQAGERGTNPNNIAVYPDMLRLDDRSPFVATFSVHPYTRQILHHLFQVRTKNNLHQLRRKTLVQKRVVQRRQPPFVATRKAGTK